MDLAGLISAAPEFQAAQREHRQQKASHQLESIMDHVKASLQRVMQSILKQEESVRKEMIEFESDPSRGAAQGKSTVKVQVEVSGRGGIRQCCTLRAREWLQVGRHGVGDYRARRA